MILVAMSDNVEIMSISATDSNKEVRKQTLIDNAKNLGFVDIAIETLTKEEYQAIKDNATPAEPSLEDRVNALEILELERLFGGL